MIKKEREKSDEIDKKFALSPEDIENIFASAFAVSNCVFGFVIVSMTKSPN